MCSKNLDLQDVTVGSLSSDDGNENVTKQVLNQQCDSSVHVSYSLVKCHFAVLCKTT